MGKGDKADAGQGFLRLAYRHIMNEVPALVMDVVHDAHIHIRKSRLKALGDDLGFRIKALVHLPGRLRVIMPLDRPAVQAVCDLHPLQPPVGKDTAPVTVRAVFTDQNLGGNPGVQQHFQVFGHDIDQRIGAAQPVEHSKNGDLYANPSEFPPYGSHTASLCKEPDGIAGILPAVL